MRLRETHVLYNKNLLMVFEWHGEEITRVVRPNDPHSEWFQRASARHDLAKRLKKKGVQL